MQKRSCKGSPIEPGSSDSLEIIFALLIEVIVVYIGLTIIYLWYLNLKVSFALRLSRSLVCLQVGLYEFFEQFIGSDRSGSRSGNRSGNQSGNQIGAQGRVTRWNGGGTTWIRTSNWARILGKLVFHWVNRKGVPMRGMTRAGSSGSHLGRWLD